jgi:hypothetical protein
MFKISKKSNSDFDIYTEMPYLIRVLPFTNNVDGITYFKTATDNGEINARKSIDDAISNVTVYSWLGHISLFSFFDLWKDIVTTDNLSSGGGLTDNYGRPIPGLFLVNNNNDGEYITSSSNEFGNVTFIKTLAGEDFKDVKVFSILVKRFYVNSEDNKLINRIKTIELSELIDCRDVLMKFVTTYVNGEGQTVDGSYVELRELETNVDVEVKVPVVTDAALIPDAEGNPSDVKVDIEEQPQEGKGSGTSKSFTQTVAFMMHIDTDGEPNVLQNQVFIDYDNMSFTFMFKLGDDEYYVDCGSITMIENTEGEGEEAVTKSIDLVFSMKCPQEMGTLCDDEGNPRTWTCNMIAKTASGFSYRVDFKVILTNSQELPETPGEEGRVITNGKIS